MRSLPWACGANVVYRTDNDDRALALVAAGFGLALVPGHLRSPGVKQVAGADLAITRTIGLVWPRSGKNGDVKEFIASLKAIAGRHSGRGRHSGAIAHACAGPVN